MIGIVGEGESGTHSYGGVMRDAQANARALEGPSAPIFSLEKGFEDLIDFCGRNRWAAVAYINMHLAILYLIADTEFALFISVVNRI
jgi:hypothetical protein